MACSSRCAARRAPHLRGLKVVNRKLLHIGWVGEAAIAKTLQARHEPLADEGVEGLAGLPEVDHAPAALDPDRPSARSSPGAGSCLSPLPREPRRSSPAFLRRT